MDAGLVCAFLLGCFIGAFSLWIIVQVLSKRGAAEKEREKNSALILLTEEKTAKAALEGRLAVQEAQIEDSRQELELSQNEIKNLNTKANALEVALAKASTQLDEERKAAEEKLALLNEARTNLSDAFKAVGAEVLKSNNESFLHLAKTQLEQFQQGAQHDLETRQKSIDEIVKPLKESLQNVDKRVEDLDKARAESHASLTEQMKMLTSTSSNLQNETQNLVRALRTPSVRGIWGEMQLKRVVEMAGMVEHCHFDEQVSLETEDGRLRPDMLIHLPGSKTVVVDSKAPLEAYLNALEATDEETRIGYLKAHAKQIRTHLTKLSEKSYWEHLDQSPEFVVLFLPGESFFSAALEQDAELIEVGARQKVIIATPTTLIALLRAVAYGWTSEKLSKNAQEISDAGKELYERICNFATHMVGMGKGIGKTVKSFNEAVASLDSRVIVSARRLQNLALPGAPEIELLEPIECAVREIQSPELLSAVKLNAEGLN
jgi:DNA recombination protein RmuC